jgi:hypothetical protein
LSPTTEEFSKISAWHEEYSSVVLTEYSAILWTFLAILTVFTIRHYANKGLFERHTYVTVFLAYFCSFGEGARGGLGAQRAPSSARVPKLLPPP